MHFFSNIIKMFVPFIQWIHKLIDWFIKLNIQLIIYMSKRQNYMRLFFSHKLRDEKMTSTVNRLATYMNLNSPSFIKYFRTLVLSPFFRLSNVLRVFIDIWVYLKNEMAIHFSISKDIRIKKGKYISHRSFPATE